MRLRTPTVILLVASCLWLAAASPLHAHGVIERSFPPANAAVQTPPRQVVLWFNEPVDPMFSSAAVLDREGRRVGERSAVSAHGRQMTTGVGGLTRGVYTVKWRVLSSVDGHITSGTFAFAVGETTGQAVAGQGVTRPTAIRVALRWVAFLSTVLLAGAVFFAAVVLQQALARADPREGSRFAASGARHLVVLKALAAVALVLSVAAEFVLQGTELLDTSFVQLVSGGSFWSLLAGTRTGLGTLLRLGMALVLLLPDSTGGRILQAGAIVWLVVIGSLVSLLGGPSGVAGSTHLPLIVLPASVYAVFTILMARILPEIPDLQLPRLAWIPPLAAAALLAGPTITAHASGSGVLAALLDWIHLLAVALWIGGLATLLIILFGMAPADRPRLSQILVPRFSAVAGISLGVLILTGLYSAVLYVPSLRALTSTAYGQALLLKLALVVPLVALGALNRFVLKPRLAAAAGAGATTLRRFLGAVTGEVGLGVLILLVVAVLTITPPAKVTLSATAQEPLILVGLATDVRVRLTITPAQPGWNQFEALAAESDGRPIASEGRLLLRATKLDENLDSKTITLVHQSDGRHVAEGGDMGLPGWWQVDVVVRRRGKLDVFTSFPLRLGQPPAAPSDPAAVELLTEARRAMDRLTTWRQTKQITDGAGGGVVNFYELARPDRIRLRNSSGNEGIFIGARRYQRQGSGLWQQDTLPRPVRPEGPEVYTREAQAVARGRTVPCGDEVCEVVLWEAQGRAAAFAGWIGLRTSLIHQLMMVGPSHYMTLRAADFNAPLRVNPPK